MSATTPATREVAPFLIDSELAYAIAHAESPGQLRVLVALSDATAGIVTEDRAQRFAQAAGVRS